MDTEQHTAEKPIGDQCNKGRNKKFLKSNEKKITILHILWDTTRAVLRG
jgi:hypothetical protein